MTYFHQVKQQRLQREGPKMFYYNLFTLSRRILAFESQATRRTKGYCLYLLYPSLGMASPLRP